MTDTQKGRSGRPPLDPAARRSRILAIRVRQILADDLRDKAQAAGRSIASEIEFRLEIARLILDGTLRARLAVTAGIDAAIDADADAEAHT